MERCLFLCVVLASIYYCSANFAYLEGYYWRDYTGTTPDDAIRGGIDRSGIPIYIGQVPYEGKIIPGKLYRNSKTIQFAWDIEQRASKNIQILCGQYLEQFKWLPTTSTEIPKLTNKFLIKGGYENGYYTYIGRIFRSGETVVGKVICRATDCLGLFIALNGKQENVGSFEVLSFNPDTESISN